MKQFEKIHPAAGYTIVFFAFLLLYGLTCARGALWQDSGMYQYRIWHNDIEGKIGLALAHPLYHMIGIAVKQIPFGEYGYRINLISSFCGALTVANIFILLRLWLGKILPAVVGAVSLGLSWTFWQHSCIAEVYTLYTAVFTVELLFLFLYFKGGQNVYLYLTALFNGLSIANHMWGIIPLACYLVLTVVLLRGNRIKIITIVVMILFWMMGAGAFEYLFVKELFRTGSMILAVKSALFGDIFAKSVLNFSISLPVILQNILFIGYSFATPTALLFFAGLFGLWKVLPDKKYGYIILWLLLLFLLFAFRYRVPDRYAFFIPFYCLMAVIIGVGADILFQKISNRTCKALVFVFLFLPVVFYWIVPVLAERRGIDIGTSRKIPYRNDYKYFLCPWQSGNEGSERFALEVLRTVEKGSMVITDGTTIYPLWYVQEIKGVNSCVMVVGSRRSYVNPDLLPTADTIDKVLAERAVYVLFPVAGYCPDYILEGYCLVDNGIVHRVTGKSGF